MINVRVDIFFRTASIRRQGKLMDMIGVCLFPFAIHVYRAGLFLSERHALLVRALKAVRP